MATTVTSQIQGITINEALKAPVRVVTTANISLSGLQTITGVALAEGDRVLVKNQTTASENGIYNASTGSWQRSKDFDGNRDVVQGTLIVSNNDTSIYYRLTTADPITIGTTSLTFEVVSGSVTQSSIGLAINPRTEAEIAAVVTPTDYAYPPGDTRRYGANGTSDGPAVENAFAQAAQAGGDAVFIPGFTHDMGTTAITVSAANVCVQGDGVKSVLQWSSAFTGSAITITGDHFQAHSFFLDKPRQASFPAVTVIAIDNQANTSEMFNVKVTSDGAAPCLGWGVGVKLANYVHKFVNCRFSAARHALLTVQANYVTAVNCNFSANALGSFGAVCYFNGGSANSLHGCDIEGDADYGIYIDDGGGASSGQGTISITGSYFEGQDTAINILGSAGPGKDVRGANISGNFISGNVSTCLVGIQANRVSGLSIIGNCLINHDDFEVVLGAVCTDVTMLGNHMSSSAAGWAATSINAAVTGLIQTEPGKLSLDFASLGFFGAAPTTQPADPGALTDSTGGTANNELLAVSGSGADATINNNFSDMIAKVNAIRTTLRNLGLMA